MISLFTTTKPFSGRFGVIQRNALRSWAMLRPRPEVTVVGDNRGTAEICRELGFAHVPQVAGNEWGTPLLNAIFEAGRSHATQPILGYVNSDIILTSSFMSGMRQALEFVAERSFLLIGRRWNVYLDEPWNFEEADWELRLTQYATSHGYLESAGATDYFLFPRELRWEIPSFAIGRGFWDGWLLYNAYRMGVPMVDATQAITVYHQQHDYSHLPGRKLQLRHQEFQRNLELRGSFARQYTIWDAPLVLTPDGLRSAGPHRRIQAHLLRLKMHIIYHLQMMHPYSYPIVACYRGARKLARLA